MSSSKKIFSGIIWTSLGNLINACYSFFSVPLLLVHFGKNEYGLIGLAISVNVYLKLMDMGFASGNVKFFSMWLAKNDMDSVRKLFQSSIVFYGIIGLVNAFILYILSIYSQQIFSLNSVQASLLKNMLYILMISAFFGWLSSLLDQFLRANEVIGWEQRLMIFVRLLQVGILLATIHFNYGIGLFFSLTTLSSLLIIPFIVWKIRKLRLEISFTPKYHHAVFRQVLPYCLSIFSFGIFQFSAIYLRPIILSVQANISTVADYRIIEGFANLVLLIGASFTAVILPAASKAITLGDSKKIEKIAYDATKYITIFVSFVVFGFIIVSNLLIDLYVGNRYSYLTIWLNIWIFTLLGTHTAALASLVLSENNLRPIVIMSAISTIISLLLGWYLTPIFQVGGVVIGYFVYIVFQISFYYFYYYPKVMKLDSRKIFIKSFFIPSLLLGIVALVSNFLSSLVIINSPYLRLFAVGGIYSFLSLLVIVFIALNFEDKKFIIGIIRLKKQK